MNSYVQGSYYQVLDEAADETDFNLNEQDVQRSRIVSPNGRVSLELLSSGGIVVLFENKDTEEKKILWYMKLLNAAIVMLV